MTLVMGPNKKPIEACHINKCEKYCHFNVYSTIYIKKKKKNYFSHLLLLNVMIITILWFG